MIHARLRRWLALDRPTELQTAFIRACLPGNPDGARDLEAWLALAGGPAVLATADNPFKLNLPALAYAVDRRGDVPPTPLRAVLGFTQLVEPMRADRYLAIIDRLSELMALEGHSGLLAGDAAVALVAYPKAEQRHITGVRIITPARSLASLRTICLREGFEREQQVADTLEMKARTGARVLLTTRLFPGDRGRMIDELLADHSGGLTPLPIRLLFVWCCVVGYPPIDAAHAPAMIDAAMLAPLLTPDDWRAVAELRRRIRRPALTAALKYLRDSLAVSVSLTL